MTIAGGQEVRLEVADGPRRLEAWARRVGSDLVVVVGGGELPHVGCVVLTQARPSTADPSRTSVTSSVLTITPHKEEPVARAIAERLARALGCVVVVTAGVHEDGLESAGADTYVRLAATLGDRLAALIAAQAPPEAGSPVSSEAGVV